MVGDDPDDQTESSGTGDEPVTGSSRDARRPRAGSLQPSSGDSNLVLATVAIIAIVAGAIWLMVTILSGNDDANDVAAQPTTTIDQGRCQRMATEWESFRIEQLVPLVDADETAVSTASFQAVSPALEDLIDTMDKWTTGLPSSTSETRFETAIADGRTLLAAIEGDDVNQSAEAASAFIDSANAAFTACQN